MKRMMVSMMAFLFALGFTPAWADEVDDEIGQLKNSEEDVREKAAERLGELGDSRALKPLIQALSDDDNDVVEKAAQSLGQIGSPEAVDPLIDAFNEHPANWGIRVKTAKAMELIGDPRALPPLQEALMDEQNPFVLSHIRRAIRTLESKQERSPAPQTSQPSKYKRPAGSVQ